MKFTLAQQFDSPLPVVIATLTDEAFWAGVDNLTTVSTPTVLDVTADGDHTTTRLRFNLIVDLPREAARFINPSAVSWVEVTRWTLPTARSETKFIPDQAGRLLAASVTTSLGASGDGTRREVDGEVKVHIPILGSKVEAAIVGGVEQYLKELTTAVDAFNS